MNEENDREKLEQQAATKKSWNACVRQGFWTVALGVIFGTAASVILASELPFSVGTGFGISVAAANCRRQFRKQEEARRARMAAMEDEEYCPCAEHPPDDCNGDYNWQEEPGGDCPPCEAAEDPCQPYPDPCQQYSDPRQQYSDPCQPAGNQRQQYSDPCQPAPNQRQQYSDPCQPAGNQRQQYSDPCRLSPDPCQTAPEPCQPAPDPCQPAADPCNEPDPCLEQSFQGCY